MCTSLKIKIQKEKVKPRPLIVLQLVMKSRRRRSIKLRWLVDVYTRTLPLCGPMASPRVQAQCSSLRGIVENTAVFLPMYDWHKCIELCISVHLIAVHITIVFNPLSLQISITIQKGGGSENLPSTSVVFGVPNGLQPSNSFRVR